LPHFSIYKVEEASVLETEGWRIMPSVVFSVVVFILVVLLLLCIALIIASLSKQKLQMEQLPACERVDLMSHKEHTMLADLNKAGEKNGLVAFPRVGLGNILRVKPGSDNADAWHKLLCAEYVDFVVCEADTAKVRLAVLHGDNISALRKGQLEQLERVCGKAGIPVLVVRDYNMAGLEKALAQKVGPVKRRGASPQAPAPSMEVLEEAAAV